MQEPICETISEEEYKKQLATVRDGSCQRSEYAVYVEGKWAPKLIHVSLKTAQEEAKRLCVQEGRTAYVVEILHKYKPEAVEIL